MVFLLKNTWFIKIQTYSDYGLDKLLWTNHFVHGNQMSNDTMMFIVWWLTIKKNDFLYLWHLLLLITSKVDYPYNDLCSATSRISGKFKGYIYQFSRDILLLFVNIKSDEKLETRIVYGLLHVYATLKWKIWGKYIAFLK